MVLESIWDRFGSDFGIIFQFESGLREKMWIFENICFTIVKHRFLRFRGFQKLRNLRALQNTI